MLRVVGLLVLVASPLTLAHWGARSGDWQNQGNSWQNGGDMQGGSWQQGGGMNWQGGNSQGGSWQNGGMQGGNSWQGGDSSQGASWQGQNAPQGGSWQQGSDVQQGGGNWQQGQNWQGGNSQGSSWQGQQQQPVSGWSSGERVDQQTSPVVVAPSSGGAVIDNGGASASAGGGQAQELPESAVYKDVNLQQYATGYGAPPNNGGVERVDQPVEQLPDIVETAQGQDTVADTHFPDANINNRYDTTKEIHSSTIQRRITNQFNRNLRRYFKQLNVNALYNTNVAHVRHAKQVNLLNVQSQDTHRPLLNVAFSRQDTVTNIGDRDESPVVENQATSNVLPPIVEQVQVSRVGYDGQAMAPGVGLRYSSEWGN